MGAFRRISSALLLAALGLPACKPPPTDAAEARSQSRVILSGPSRPLASPDTEGAVWTESGGAMRLVYGIPGQPVLVALECLDPSTPGARLRITRHAPADAGAGALLALIGNGWIARIPVDAKVIAGRSLWQGEAPAGLREWDALKPVREATVTVPGAGLVRLNPGPLPMQLVEACRKVPQPSPSPAAPANPR